MAGAPLPQFMGEENKAKVQEYVGMMRDDLAYLLDERDIDAEVQAAISFLAPSTASRCWGGTSSR